MNAPLAKLGIINALCESNIHLEKSHESKVLTYVLIAIAKLG